MEHRKPTHFLLLTSVFFLHSGKGDTPPAVRQRESERYSKTRHTSAYSYLFSCKPQQLPWRNVLGKQLGEIR